MAAHAEMDVATAIEFRQYVTDHMHTGTGAHYSMKWLRTPQILPDLTWHIACMQVSARAARGTERSIQSSFIPTRRSRTCTCSASTGPGQQTCRVTPSPRSLGCACSRRPAAWTASTSSSPSAMSACLEDLEKAHIQQQPETNSHGYSQHSHKHSTPSRHRHQQPRAAGRQPSLSKLHSSVLYYI